MAVHAYRMVEQWGKEKGIEPVFSYLDARKLRLIIDPGQETYIGRAVPFSLRDLIRLHGWTLLHDPRTQAVLPQTAQALAHICADPAGLDAWRDWKSQELKKCYRDPSRRSLLPDSQLRQVRLSLPVTNHLLQGVMQTLRHELHLTTDELVVGEVERKYGYKTPKDVYNWLDGVWLEHYMLDTLNTLRDPTHQLYLNECTQNVETREVTFDVDVVALRGYQLFAFSCSTDTDVAAGGTSNLKKRLFEAYIRARQLGGDEACVALVCCADHPQRLQDELRRALHASQRIRVFGRQDFPDLANQLSMWIRRESQE